MDDDDSALLVRITPSQSAFFAGEPFAATITFTNPAPPPDDPPSLHALHSLSHLPPSRSAALAASPAPHSAAQQPIAGRGRPPSASHLGLAEYASSHLDSDEVPPSPFIGSSSDAFPSSSIAEPSSSSHRPQPSPGFSRQNTVSTSSGGALPTPRSATFAPSSFAPRSSSGFASPLASTSHSTLPTRKGLIGKPVAKPPVLDRRVTGGLYPGGPRRPGDVRGHGRTQSMAVSSPDILESASGHDRNGMPGTPRVHGRSRLGGSVSVDSSTLTALGIQERKSSARVPPLIEEEPPSLSPAVDSSPSPSFTSTPSTSTPSLDTTPTRKNYPYSEQSRQQTTELSSTFSLANSDGSDYDPNDSASALPGRGFYGVGQNDTMDSLVRDGLEDWTRKTTAQGSPSAFAPYSAPPSLRSFSEGKYLATGMPGSQPRGTPFLYPENTITVLWSFAHLEGTFEVDEALVKPAEFVDVKRGLLGGAGSGIGMGGGTLEEPASGRGWRRWLWSTGDSPKGGAASLEERKNLTMKEKTIPTFSSPPSILGVDLVLTPGQSKSYSFSIRVPADLPPSFRGKAIKFSYHLVVGTNRSPPGGPMSPRAGSAKDSISRVMRVPVRMYNHVGVTGARPFYDLTNPVVYHRDEATTAPVDDGNDYKVAKKARRPSTGSGRAEFEAYSAALLDSLSVAPSSTSVHPRLPMLSPPLAPMMSPTLMESPPSLRPERRSRSQQVTNPLLPDEESMGCKAAVEIVSRNSQKVSYDINKDGYMVASLTLVKSSYRLGETVNGSVVINSGEGRVVRVSARLETHELIETSIATRPAPQIRQITRRLHAEHHEMTLDSARIGFALAIPSGATPDFATSGVKLQWSVRLSFLVIPPSPDTPAKGASPARSGRSGAPPLPSAPPTGSPSRHGRSKSFAYGFEPAVPLTLPAAPLIPPTGAAHLMPVYGPLDTSAAHTSYRAVPDLGFVPVLFSSNAPEAPPPPGPLQRSASGSSHRSTASLSLPRTPGLTQQASVVLVPAKVETVECSIPIKVYPGNTPFRPTISVFQDTR